MTKGALATGLGVALLIGSGGSLAVWNTNAEANPGTIVAGDVGLKAAAGAWTNSVGTDVTGKIVPDDSLTFTQPVKVTLSGDLLKGKLSVTETALTGDTTINQKNYTVGPVALTDSTQKSVVGQELTQNGSHTASVTFAFLKSTTNLDDTNSTDDFSKVAYKLAAVASSSD